jgi:hypothetical protein
VRHLCEWTTLAENRWAHVGRKLTLPNQNRSDLVLGRLWRFPISPLFSVTASASTAHLYIIGMSGKGKFRLLQYCLISERIKASVTVLEFVSQYVDLKPTASGAVGLCPFHDDHHPSFGVNAEGNYWNCFAGCGGGSVIDFWMKWRKCDFTTAVRELAEMVL